MSVILIVGGSGLLGVNWGFRLCSSQSVILGLHEKKIHLSGTRSVMIDIGSIDSIETAIEKWAVDIVINAAAITNIEFCESNPEKAHYVNVVLATNECLAKSMKMLPKVLE